MDQLLRLGLDRLDHRRRAVADGQRADATDKIDEGVAVDVVHERAIGAIDDDVGRLAETRGNRRHAPGEQRFAAGAGYFRLQLNR